MCWQKHNTICILRLAYSTYLYTVLANCIENLEFEKYIYQQQIAMHVPNVAMFRRNCWVRIHMWKKPKRFLPANNFVNVQHLPCWGSEATKTTWMKCFKLEKSMFYNHIFKPYMMILWKLRKEGENYLCWIIQPGWNVCCQWNEDL